jgi:nucleoside-diphosphate-sugar epimerase
MLMSDDPHKVIEINVLGTANLLEIARVHGMRRLVFCSSTSAYGPTEPPALGTGIKEEAPLRPSRVYGASKAAAEQILAGYRAQCSLDAVSIRLSWVFGPHRATPCIIRTMLENARNGDATRVDWGRDFPRQYIFVDDAAAALIAALSAPKIAAPAYTATGGTWLTIGQVADVVRAIVPKADITLADGPDPFDDYQHRFDVSAIQRDLGFRPAYGLEAGIRAYKKWLDSQPFGHRQGASP